MLQPRLPDGQVFFVPSVRMKLKKSFALVLKPLFSIGNILFKQLYFLLKQLHILFATLYFANWVKNNNVFSGVKRDTLMKKEHLKLSAEDCEFLRSLLSKGSLKVKKQ